MLSKGCEGHGNEILDRVKPPGLEGLLPKRKNWATWLEEKVKTAITKTIEVPFKHIESDYRSKTLEATQKGQTATQNLAKKTSKGTKKVLEETPIAIEERTEKLFETDLKNKDRGIFKETLTRMLKDINENPQNDINTAYTTYLKKCFEYAMLTPEKRIYFLIQYTQKTQDKEAVTQILKTSPGPTFHPLKNPQCLTDLTQLLQNTSIENLPQQTQNIYNILYKYTENKSQDLEGNLQVFDHSNAHYDTIWTSPKVIQELEANGNPATVTNDFLGNFLSGFKNYHQAFQKNSQNATPEEIQGYMKKLDAIFKKTHQYARENPHRLDDDRYTEITPRKTLQNINQIANQVIKSHNQINNENHPTIQINQVLTPQEIQKIWNPQILTPNTILQSFSQNQKIQENQESILFA